MEDEFYSKPDFIGIGPPKTGTTWIYQNLLNHPQVEMPLDKEIRYFWERCFIGQLSLQEWVRSDHWHVRGRRAFHRNRFRGHLSSLVSFKLKVKELLWDIKYLKKDKTDRWYASLFNPNVIAGDISAKYCELPGEEIQRIRTAFPELKIIITLRDPIEREWSRAKMNLSKKPSRELAAVSDQEFIDQFNDPPQRKSNDYVNLIELWRDSFASSQILVLFYDELLQSPFAYFSKLCAFLDITPPGDHDRDQLEQYVFKGVKGSVPDRYKKLLFEMHEGNIMRLVEYFPRVDYPKLWLEKYQGKTGPSAAG